MDAEDVQWQQVVQACREVARFLNKEAGRDRSCEVHTAGSDGLVFADGVNVQVACDAWAGLLGQEAYRVEKLAIASDSDQTGHPRAIQRLRQMLDSIALRPDDDNLFDPS